MSTTESTTDDPKKRLSDRLNEWVAITVVVISVFMAISNVKDGNIGQNMALAKADAVDAWNEYQAGRIKLHVDEDMLAQLTPERLRNTVFLTDCMSPVTGFEALFKTGDQTVPSQDITEPSVRSASSRCSVPTSKLVQAVTHVQRDPAQVRFEAQLESSQQPSPAEVPQAGVTEAPASPPSAADPRLRFRRSGMYRAEWP